MTTPVVDPTKLGNETRTSILPVQSVSADLFGPSYNYADELPLPDQVGVKRGNGLKDVVNAVKGVAFYSDMLAYGAPSSSLTNALPIKPYPMGINYYLRTYTKCSNGADMWSYIQGIPEGTGVGTKIQQALARSGMPPLKGLAPGLLEDSKEALDASPLINALVGSGYAKCKQVTLPVGDAQGRIQGSGGTPWIKPLYPGDIQYRNRRPHQTRWVFDKWMTQEEFQKEYRVREICPDGTRIVDHEQEDCSKPYRKAEGWSDYTTDSVDRIVPSILVAAAGIALYMRFRQTP